LEDYFSGFWQRTFPEKSEKERSLLELLADDLRRREINVIKQVWNLTEIGKFFDTL